MKRIVRLSILLVAVSLALSSCKTDTSNMRKKITGKAGEMVVVLPKNYWNGSVGKAFREVMAQSQLGLPQDEPIFDLIDVPPEAFKEIFKTTRNIVRINISSEIDTSRVVYKKDVWAWPQAVVIISAKSPEDFQQLFKMNSDRIVAYMLKAERNRLQRNYRKYYAKAVKAKILKKFNINIDVPPGFVVTNDSTKNFAWIRYETPDISQGILVYTYPYKSDSTFTQNYLLDLQDSILKADVPGPRDGSYMMTERKLPPVFNVFKYKNNYAAGLRGLWRVNGDFMGGPYINLSVLDASKNRIVTLYGFVYAPKSDKRNYIRQVEAMMYTMTFPDQKANDKVNTQINMGN
ncbi:MAG TPA: DUF4837 family protein [Sunxiuqinia sp.]|nr:DUF4837 family protein [Sunxiuqinia sp.]